MKAIITKTREGYKNGIVLVDDENYEMLSQYNWSLNGVGYTHTAIKIDSKWVTKGMHQLILQVPKNMEVDHIDRNKLNNQKDNLRIVTRSQNRINVEPRKNGTSKYKGICWIENRNKWQAQIGYKGKVIFLGYFINEEDAALAYDKKAVELFGEYAYLNVKKSNDR